MDMRYGDTLSAEPAAASIADLDLPLERDGFLRTMLRELSGSLQDVVGMQEAAGYISIVGAHVGRHIDATYKQALRVDKLSRAQVSDVLVDLKARIKGDFRIVEETADRIVFVNTKCPFGHFVEGRPSLCMMTSNVFGYIAAENLGYARVDIQGAIATGDPGCHVVVHFTPGPPSETAREYYSVTDLTLD